MCALPQSPAGLTGPVAAARPRVEHTIQRSAVRASMLGDVAGFAYGAAGAHTLSWEECVP